MATLATALLLLLALSAAAPARRTATALTARDASTSAASDESTIVVYFVPVPNARENSTGHRGLSEYVSGLNQSCAMMAASFSRVVFAGDTTFLHDYAISSCIPLVDLSLHMTFDTLPHAEDAAAVGDDCDAKFPRWNDISVVRNATRIYLSKIDVLCRAARRPGHPERHVLVDAMIARQPDTYEDLIELVSNTERLGFDEPNVPADSLLLRTEAYGRVDEFGEVVPEDFGDSGRIEPPPSCIGLDNRGQPCEARGWYGTPGCDREIDWLGHGTVSEYLGEPTGRGLVLARLLATEESKCDELERLYGDEIAAVRADSECPCYDEERILSRLHARLPGRIRRRYVDPDRQLRPSTRP